MCTILFLSPYASASLWIVTGKKNVIILNFYKKKKCLNKYVQNKHSEICIQEFLISYKNIRVHFKTQITKAFPHIFNSLDKNYQKGGNEFFF